MELLVGIEPTTRDYKSLVLPLNYRSICDLLDYLLQTEIILTKINQLRLGYNISSSLDASSLRRVDGKPLSLYPLQHRVNSLRFVMTSTYLHINIDSSVHCANRKDVLLVTPGIVEIPLPE